MIPIDQQDVDAIWLHKHTFFQNIVAEPQE